MELINEFAAKQAVCPVSAIALGTFDGVHAGHQRIISRAVELSRRLEGRSMVFTSVNHPLSCIFPDKCPRSLTKSQEKAGLISGLGVDVLTQIIFTPAILAISPETFIDLLYRQFEPKCIVIGSNYTFGRGGAGNVETLQRLSRQYGYRLEVPDSVTMNGLMVSSTEIRRLISIGSLAAAERMLTRPVQLTGYVKQLEKGSPKELRVLVESEESMAVPCDGLYNVCISSDNGRRTGGELARLSRGMSMKKGILRIELQFLGSSSARFMQRDEGFAKLIFTEIVSSDRAASEG